MTLHYTEVLSTHMVDTEGTQTNDDTFESKKELKPTRTKTTDETAKVIKSHARAAGFCAPDGLLLIILRMITNR